MDEINLAGGVLGGRPLQLVITDNRGVYRLHAANPAREGHRVHEAPGIDGDAFVRDAIDDHTTAFRDQTRMTTAYTPTLMMMNATLIVSMAAVALWQWSEGNIAIGAVAANRAASTALTRSSDTRSVGAGASAGRASSSRSAARSA